MTMHQRLFADYDAFHGHPLNRACHFIGIPMIVGTLLGMALRWDFVTVGRFGVSAGYVLLALATLYTAVIAPRLALPALAAAAFLGTLGRTLPLRYALAGFIVGWVFQFVGHYAFEKKSPAFVKNAGHLLIGPLYVLEQAMR